MGTGSPAADMSNKRAGMQIPPLGPPARPSIRQARRFPTGESNALSNNTLMWPCEMIPIA